MEMIKFLAPPMVMCLILGGIHCYLGIHVLKRGVIFVDLALAQVASLGGTVALLFHFDHHSPLSYGISLLFALVAAFYFAWGRKFERYVPQEVLIALVYAFSSAMVILVVNMMAHGAEHIKEILIGKILWATWGDVAKVALIYAPISFLHVIYKTEMFQATTKGRGLFWDFVFYALFGVVITSSVGVAGILLVFSYLVVPALLSINMAISLKHQLLIGWGCSFLLSFVGMGLSVLFDLPAGAILVVTFTLAPLVYFPLKQLRISFCGPRGSSL